MNEKIIQYLDKIEKEKDVKILLACETGSRAWGFPSPDSDFDIRIIYVHKKDWYLSLSEKRDSIDLMFENNEIDITGWDLRKSLRLLQKSNPPLLERIQSPILYKHNSSFLKEMNDLANSQYSRIATIHHYLSMAKKFLEDIYGRLNSGGMFIMTSPYTWLEEFTPKEDWIGGYKKDGENFTTLDGLKEVLEKDFKLIDTKDVPFVIRETARKYQHTVAQMSVWEKK